MMIEYTWDCFHAWMSKHEPKIRVPQTGCVPELLALFRKHRGLRTRVITAMSKAPGDRALAIYYARRGGWEGATD